MIKKDFIETNNVIMLWEVLSDDALIKNQSVGVQEEIKSQLINGLRTFYERFKKEDIDLVEINKRYLKEVMNAVREEYPLKLSKLKIHHNSPIEILDVTSEKIRNRRETDMNMKQNELQNDFDSIMNIERPEPLKFEEDINCTPINQEDIDAIISERNNDIQPFPIDDNISNEFQEMMNRNSKIDEEISNVDVRRHVSKNVTWSKNESISDKKKVKMFFHDLDNFDEKNNDNDNKFYQSVETHEKENNNIHEIQELVDELNRIKGNISAIEKRLNVIEENMSNNSQ